MWAPLDPKNISIWGMTLTLSLSLSLLQAPPQMGTLTYYRYEQPIVDYCQAHQSLHMNRGFEPSSQALEGLGARERCSVPSAGLLPSVPAAPLPDMRPLPQWAARRLFSTNVSPEGVRPTQREPKPAENRDKWGSVTHVNSRWYSEERMDSEACCHELG